jgi:UDPglucose 6-dehydrogenase
VAVLGVTFKPNTDDMRDAPSLMIVPCCRRGAARIRAYDPQGRAKPEVLLPDVEWCESALEAAATPVVRQRSEADKGYAADPPPAA